MLWKGLQDIQLSDKSKMQNSMYDVSPFVVFEKRNGEKKIYIDLLYMH